jgi:RNA polymerase sigma-70 factor (ECF subfamily)
MTGSAAEADDLVQEAAIRALEKSEQVTDADPTGWLFTLTRHLCLDHLRRRQRPEVPAQDDAPTAPADVALVLHEEVRFAVLVALQALPPRQRAVMMLHAVLGWPLGDVAAALGLNANAAKALLHRARAGLHSRGRM